MKVLLCSFAPFAHQATASVTSAIVARSWCRCLSVAAVIGTQRQCFDAVIKVAYNNDRHERSVGNREITFVRRRFSPLRRSRRFVVRIRW